MRRATEPDQKRGKPPARSDLRTSLSALPVGDPVPSCEFRLPGLDPIHITRRGHQSRYCRQWTPTGNTRDQWGWSRLRNRLPSPSARRPRKSCRGKTHPHRHQGAPDRLRWSARGSLPEGARTPISSPCSSFLSHDIELGVFHLGCSIGPRARLFPKNAHKGLGYEGSQLV